MDRSLPQLELGTLTSADHLPRAETERAHTTGESTRRCIVCSRPEGVVQFASEEAVRCTDCIRAHGAAVSAQKRSAAGRKAKSSTLRARQLAERQATEDAALQERAAARALARGETYVPKAVLSPQDRLVLQSAEETERRLEREIRRAARVQEAAERTSAVAIRKAERRPLAQLARRLAPGLAAATTLDEEIQTLVVGLDDRASAWVLRRWGYLEWPAPTLESLGEAAGVTRERVRQVVTLHEKRLAELRAGEGALRLPLAERAVAALSARGGMLSSAAFESALETDGILASPAARRALLALAAAGVLPSIRWDPLSDLWLDAANQQVLQDGSLHDARRRLLHGGRRALRRTGAVNLARIANAAPVPYDHAITLLLGSTTATRVSGYLVPDEQADSRLARCALQIATLSPGVELDEIRLGLRRIVPHPIRLPAPVIRAVLERHRAFRLEGGAVFVVDPPALEDMLYPADVAFIDALRQRNGVMLFPEVKAMLASAGISPGYFLRAAHAPWVVGLRGAFGLRGHPGVAGLAETNERRSPGLPRSRVFVKLLWPDEQSAVIRYRVIPASLRGVLRIPNRLATRLGEPGAPWSVSATPALPAHGSVQVSADGESLWDLRPWLIAAGARAGQHIEVAVDLQQRRVQLRLIGPADAKADEARWAEERAIRWSVRPPSSGSTAPSLGGRRRREARTRDVTVREFGDYFTVPNHAPDLSDVVFLRVRGTPAPESDLLVAALPSFPLAPGTTGVTMCLIFPLTATRGKRLLYSDLLESRLLERGSSVSWDEAAALVRHLDRHLMRGRLALAWREYRPVAEPQGVTADQHVGTVEQGRHT